MAYKKNERQQVKFLWDFAGGAGANSSAATGTIALMTAPASSVIHAVKAQVITAVTGATAETVGDAGDVDGYLVDNFAANAGFYPSATNAATNGVYMQAAGTTDAADVCPENKAYSTATAINFILSGTATAGKIQFLIDFEVLA
jgi:hypothetical protein